MKWNEWNTAMKCMYVLFLSSIITWLVFLYLLFGPPYKLYQFIEPPNPVVPVYAGERMLYRMHVRRNTAVPINVSKQLENSQRAIFLERIEGSTGYIGEHNILGGLKDPIPLDTPPMEYRFRWTATIPVNFLRTDTITVLSDWFVISPARSK